MRPRSLTNWAANSSGWLSGLFISHSNESVNYGNFNSIFIIFSPILDPNDSNYPFLIRFSTEYKLKWSWISISLFIINETNDAKPMLQYYLKCIILTVDMLRQASSKCFFSKNITQKINCEQFLNFDVFLIFRP